MLFDQRPILSTVYTSAHILQDQERLCAHCIAVHVYKIAINHTLYHQTCAILDSG